MRTYNSVQPTMEMKKKFVLERLKAAGVIKSQQGQDIHELDYDELKYELVLQSFREIDVQSDKNKWF